MRKFNKRDGIKKMYAGSINNTEGERGGAQKTGKKIRRNRKNSNI